MFAFKLAMSLRTSSCAFEAFATHCLPSISVAWYLLPFTRWYFTIMSSSAFLSSTTTIASERSSKGSAMMSSSYDFLFFSHSSFVFVAFCIICIIVWQMKARERSYDHACWRNETHDRTATHVSLSVCVCVFACKMLHRLSSWLGKTDHTPMGAHGFY